MNKLTDLAHWKAQQGLPRIEIEDTNIVKLWLERNLDLESLGSCIEVGCYPGRYLTIFAEKGVLINGIDYIPEIQDLPKIYKQKGYKVGKFYCVDFEEQAISEKYDCVYSLGFIEHFREWEPLLLKHARMVNYGGFLVIEVPNYRGWLQRIPRYVFDQANYRRHNLAAMQLESWKKIVESQGFDVITAEAFGGYQLWFTGKSGPIERIVRFVFTGFLKILRRVLYPNNENHPSFSAAIGMVARRKKIE